MTKPNRQTFSPVSWACVLFLVPHSKEAFLNGQSCGFDHAFYRGDSVGFVGSFFSLRGRPTTIDLHPVPEGFSIDLRNLGLSEAETTGYGREPLVYVHAGDLAKHRFSSDDDHEPADEATLAFLRELPPDYPVIPYVFCC